VDEVRSGRIHHHRPNDSGRPFMFRTLKARWRAFIAVPRGERFQAHHRQSDRKDAPPWARYATIASAVVLIALGIVMLALPGPGLLAILAGGILLAGESLLAARALDRLDLVALHVRERWRSRT
jgi:hypothetical protein